MSQLRKLLRVEEDRNVQRRTRVQTFSPQDGNGWDHTVNLSISASITRIDSHRNGRSLITRIEGDSSVGSNSDDGCPAKFIDKHLDVFGLWSRYIAIEIPLVPLRFKQCIPGRDGDLESELYEYLADLPKWREFSDFCRIIREREVLLVLRISEVDTDGIVKSRSNWEGFMLGYLWRIVQVVEEFYGISRINIWWLVKIDWDSLLLTTMEFGNFSLVLTMWD